jgi:hypothetical protein
MLKMIMSSLIPVVGLLLTSYYYSKRSYGKGYVASAALSALVAIFGVFAGIATLGAPDVLVAWLVQKEPEQVKHLLAPDLAVIGVSAVMGAYLGWSIYKIAMAAIQNDDTPINSSALDYFEFGQRPGIVPLALAHWKYALARRPDGPVHNPGESPYSLAHVEPTVDWATLSADLLTQMEPSLDRLSFRYIDQRDLYLLLKVNPFRPEEATRWLVFSAPDGLSDQEIIVNVRSRFPIDLEQDAHVRLVACVNSRASRDEEVPAWGERTLRIITEGSLVNLSLDFSSYAASLVQRFDQRFIPGTDYSLSQCFVRPTMTAGIGGTVPEDGTNRTLGNVDVLDYLEDWSVAAGVGHISIIGEYGQGKSTALLAFCASWARRWAVGDRGGRVPLLIELRGKSPKRQTPEVFLGEWGQRYRLNGEALHNLVRTGQTVLIFEGFDEIQDAGLRLERIEQFNALWSLSYPGTRLVFTGRPNFFLDTFEMRRLLKDSRTDRDAGLGSSEIYSLSFMDLDGIADALRCVDPSRRNEIVELCRHDNAFFDIARRPSMLPVIASQWDQIKQEASGASGITSARIIRSFIDFLYARKESDVDRLGEYQVLHREVRHYFTQRVSWRMADARLSNTIPISVFSSEVVAGLDWLDAEFRARPDEGTAMATSIKMLRARYQGRPQSELVAAVSHDVRTYGLLVPDPAGGPGNLYFPHKQYFEYLLGEVFWMREQSARCAWARRLSSTQVANTLLSEPLSLLFASGLWAEAELVRPIGTPAVWKLIDTAAGVVVSLLATFNLVFNALLRMAEVVLTSLRREASFRRMLDITDLIGLPLALRPIIFANSFYVFPQGDMVVSRTANNIMFSLNILMVAPMLVAMFTYSTENDPFFRTLYIMLPLTMVIMTLIMVSVRRARSLRVCGLIMEYYRFGRFRSVQPRSARGRMLLFASIFGASSRSAFHLAAGTLEEASGRQFDYTSSPSEAGSR